MPVQYCAREGCDRLISISSIPGGNPTALAEPDKFAIIYAQCTCGAFTCDRCAQHVTAGQCPRCKTQLRLTYPIPAAPPAPVVVPPSMPRPALRKRPWWRFWGDDEAGDVVEFRGFSADGARFAYV